MAGGQGGAATCSFVWPGWVTWHQHTNTGEEVRSCFYCQVDTGDLTMVLGVEKSDISQNVCLCASKSRELIILLLENTSADKIRVVSMT